ncbi:MAG: hypothetical protein K2G03_03605 [Bacilli bacterium]|nr:hypothetical protein [Bacilli bacterium]
MKNSKEIRRTLWEIEGEILEKLKEEQEELEKSLLVYRLGGSKKMIKQRDIELISIKENIVLWGTYYKYSLCPRLYFYTDIEGKLLFDGTIFQYATPFSDSCALVKQDNDWYIIDLKIMEFVGLPNEILPYTANGFENGNLAIFDRKKEHWGSYYYSREDKTFKQDIPFIWDALEFLRKKEDVYVGIHDIYKTPGINEDAYESYFKYEEEYYEDLKANLSKARKEGIPVIGNIGRPPRDIRDLSQNMDLSVDALFDCQTIRFTIFKLEKLFAYDLDRYQELLNIHKDNSCKEIIKVRKYWQWNNRNNPILVKKRKKDVLDTIAYVANIGDAYSENYNDELNNNDGTIVDVGRLKDYHKVLGRLNI